MKLAFKDSLGQWKENQFVYKSPKACSTLKEIFGNAWTAFTLGVGFPSTNCPIYPVKYYLTNIIIIYSVINNYNNTQMLSVLKA